MTIGRKHKTQRVIDGDGRFLVAIGVQLDWPGADRVAQPVHRGQGQWPLQPQVAMRRHDTGRIDHLLGATGGRIVIFITIES